MRKIERALISVYDKTDLLEIATALAERGVEILSTGGTAQHLRDAGIDILDVSDYTGFPEMLDGRVKTLHPKIHGGLLAEWDNTEHSTQTEAHGINPIDMVICNLYPFEATVAKPDVTLPEAIENIDIGGPTMIRAAAKNYRHTAVVTAASQYTRIIADLDANDGCLSEERRFELAKAAFAHTAQYDAAISTYLTNVDSESDAVDDSVRLETAPTEVSKDEFTDSLTLRFKKERTLRYGENPHQRAAFYKTETDPGACAAWANQLSGQPLSFNNILDLEAALEIVKDFTQPVCAIIKHNNPCGLATADNLQNAFTQALECDRTSAFGSIVGLNRKVTIQTANTIREAANAGVKIDAIIAPSYTEKALRALSRVKRRPILETGPLATAQGSVPATMQIRNVTGGVLVQDLDVHELSPDALEVVTQRAPTDAEIASLLFAWKACKHVKSNCILLAQDTQSVGIGAGQMSRVDSTIIAVRKSGEKAKGAVLASDAYFPFPDGVEIAGEAGIRAIIQPGGSVNDAPVIETANAYGMAMVLTGVRHFRH
ncbi:bifunctional phosphoribosylaminoimidazolecarboxamide formyltransferase/IMP cyclohydrolase [Candidatus Poribacteria bacterium]|nr:bifunctional phosphoribosylaminoimidazolecarboxamide formyltransferase/IMP cyclohydrolase [Candidatus Poribacteria bacterium]MXY28943.1 bifunctional phosphoribosylaminoimidazolecarboxamide formyltransferase/IMP cyclohydrolase [Candidatus Poribacteria bacterium]MYK18573.1 bifunctional phosphoribosylaminoimidazolecarboxamide formyltransferase/IMP cyclohydrolase [Candidatus Poribacteria bacterium]